MTWSYRVLRHRRDDETWYELHEVYYWRDGRPRAYAPDLFTFVSYEDEGPGGILRALRRALITAENLPVLNADADFPTAEEAYADEPPPIPIEEVGAGMQRGGSG